MKTPRWSWKTASSAPFVAAAPVASRVRHARAARAEPTAATRTDEALPRTETEYRAPSSADPDFDPMTLIASAMDVREQILEAAMASLGEAHERGIALVLVDAIDDRGFLSLDVGEIAIETGANQQDIERVLQTIQEIAPPGVGARSLQESLLLQVDYLRAEGVDVPEIVKCVIENHLEELGSKRIARIARALGVNPPEVEAAQSFIRYQLTPHPLQSHQSTTWTAPSSGGHVVPDVVVTIEGDQLWIEVPNAIYDRLHTEAFYRAIAKPDGAVKGVPDAIDPTFMDQATVSHAKAQVARAQQFIWAVRQRKQTLLRVAEYVCAYQEAYIRGDARGLRSLTRSEVANALGVHKIDMQPRGRRQVHHAAVTQGHPDERPVRRLAEHQTRDPADHQRRVRLRNHPQRCPDQRSAPRSRHPHRASHRGQVPQPDAHPAVDHPLVGKTSGNLVRSSRPAPGEFFLRSRAFSTEQTIDKALSVRR